MGFLGCKAVRIGMTLPASQVLKQRVCKELREWGGEDPDLNLLEFGAKVQVDDPSRSAAGMGFAIASSAVLPPDVTPAKIVAAQFNVMQRMARHAEAIVMTCASSGNRALLRGLSTLPILVLDEAAQCVEPGPLVSLCLGAECMVAVGDEKQLPATVLDREACQRGLGCSLFERLIRDGVVDVDRGFVQLDEQRRMHPSIAAFPSKRFYGNAVRNGCSSLERPRLPGFPWPSFDCSVCFVDCAGFEETGKSKSNSVEAEALVSALRSCLMAGTKASDIAIITGYSAQQSLLQRLVRQMDLPTEGLRVDTVDGFQGSERELVLVSTVRTNSEVGFMRDPRRVNVLLTRARRGLIVFGDALTLESESDVWKPWVDWLHEQRAVLSLDRMLDLIF